MSDPTISAPLQFGPEGRFVLQPLERRLLVDGEPSPIGARAFDLLLELSSRPGALRSKGELIEAVWPGVIVEEGNLATQISALRKVLGGDVIATIPGRGYRFAARLDPVAAASAPQAEPKLKTNLPHLLRTLLGRADDLTALGALIDRHHLVSIVGAGGMGKSLLAQHLLDGGRSAYTHGVCWVELGALQDPNAVASTIASALGLNLGNGEPLRTLCALAAPLEMLVALDNAEHLLDGVVRVVQALLDAAPSVRLVVTSQATLQLAAEQVFRIEGLAVPTDPLPASKALQFGAVALFAERAQAADSRWKLTEDNLPAVIEVCAQLDGLPLAIELAAARAPLLGVRRLAASMGDRLRLLNAGSDRLAPARQRTLRAALEWSHGFLDPREQTVFRRLAVFVGSGSLEMIQQVVADSAEVAEGDSEQALDAWAVLDALVQLVDRSLLTVLQGDDGADPRYRLLDSPRTFALEQLRSAGEEHALRQRHLDAVAAFCEAASQTWLSADIGMMDWLRDLEPDADNARDAMAYAVATGQRAAALQIGTIRLRRAQDLPAVERTELAETCIAQLDDTVPPALRLLTWILLSFAVSGIQTGRSIEAVRAALDLMRGTGALQQDRWLRYYTLCSFVGASARGAGGDPEVQAALAEIRVLEDPGWPPAKRRLRAQAEYRVADPESPEALHLCRETLNLTLAASSSGLIFRSNLIDAELAAGDARAAAQTGEELLEDLQGGRNERALAFTRLNLAAACLALGDVPRARAVAKSGWPQGQRFGLEPYWADYLTLLAALDSRPRAAARLAGYADAAYAACDEQREFNEAAAYTRGCTVARAAVGEAEFERLIAEGRLLHGEQIEAIAFAEVD